MITYGKIFKLTIQKCAAETLAAFICLTIMALLPAFEIHMFHYLVSQLENGWKRELILIIVLYLASALLFSSVMMALYQYCINRIKCKMDTILASKALKKTLTASVTNIESGEGVNTAYRASQTQYNGIAQVVFDLIELCLTMIQFAVIVISLKEMGVAAAILGVCLVPATYKMRYQLSDEGMHFYWSLDEKKRYTDTIYNLFFNREYACEIRQYKASDWLFAEYRERKQAINGEEMEFEKRMQRAGNRIDYLQVAAVIFFILLSYLLSYNEIISVTWGITCIYTADKWSNSISRLVDKLNQYSMKKFYLDEYNKQMTKKDEYGEQAELMDGIAFEIKDLKYQYKNADKNALDGVSLQIGRGEKIALVGVNGSGKSTLIRLLLGFDTAQQGDILYNGIPINKSMRSLREHTTFMHQKFFKYNLSLRDNIVISDSAIREEEALERVIAWAELEEMIGKLDFKSDTEIIQGNQLSGGEWQKVALARTKFRDREFVIMDEPNAAIDASYEVKLYQKLMELGKDKTMIIVSHRLPICQLADRIIVMQEGKVAETGKHQELMAIESGVYRSLFEMQARLYAKEG